MADEEDFVMFLRDKTILARFSKLEVRDLIDRLADLGYEIAKKEKPQSND